jgi:hypothetical protein
VDLVKLALHTRPISRLLSLFLVALNGIPHRAVDYTRTLLLAFQFKSTPLSVKVVCFRQYGLMNDIERALPVRWPAVYLLRHAVEYYDWMLRRAEHRLELL